MSEDKKRSFTTFDHHEADHKGGEFWQDPQNWSNAESTDTEFRMVLPPPNVTGVLHLGHALTVTIQDVLARYHWLTGKKIRWIPGTDHAGIATQVVVEKDLRKETGKSRHDLGREAFLKRVWDWKDQNSDTIISQLKVMSPLLEYSSEQFTMNSDLSREVSSAFVELYKRGKIFRANRMVDYCCELQTSISNIEIDHVEVNGFEKHNCPNGIVADVGRMYEIDYEVDPDTLPPNTTLESIIVSTTRPETMFGDICVAVHPDDPRYQHLEGVRLKIPFTNITIPLIYDSVLPKPELGTGAVKVTPAHDPKDYDMYCRRKTDNLFDRKSREYYEVIDDSGNMDFSQILEDEPNSLLPEIVEQIGGRNRYIGRKILTKLLENKGLIRNIKPHKTTLNVCSRTGDILEPKLRPQWFVDTLDMCQRSLEAVESGSLQLLNNNGEPSEIHQHTWKRFLEDGRPWCISRQLWWGHRIPAYQIRFDNDAYADHPIQNTWIVAETEEDAYAQAREMLGKAGIYVMDVEFHLYQDPDVLDTWFSSGIYPFTILGGSVFPSDVLETGKDILFFWVARMVMLSLELRNELPFKKVFLHNMVRDKEGRKMSKSLGNVIDPLDVINGITQKDMIARIQNSNLGSKEVTFAIKNIKKHFPQGIKSYGVDSLRMGLMYYMRQDSDINLNVDIFKSAHALLNKVWQIINLYDILVTEHEDSIDQVQSDSAKPEKYSDLISNLSEWIDRREKEYLDFSHYESYTLSTVYDRVQDYVLNIFAPSYLEAVKVLITDKDEFYHLKHSTRGYLLNQLREKIVRLIKYLHPMAPNATLLMVERLGMTVTDLRDLNIRKNTILDLIVTDNTFNHVLEIISDINSQKSRKTKQVNWHDTNDTYVNWVPIVSHLTRTTVIFVCTSDATKIECFETE